MKAKAGRPDQGELTRDMYALYTLLRAHGAFDESAHEDGGEMEIPFAELADELDTDAESVMRLADALSCCGADYQLLEPFYTDEEKNALVIYSAFPVLEKSLRLSPVECHAVLCALDRAGVPEDDILRIELTRKAGSKGFEPDNAPMVTESARSKIELLVKAIDENLIVRFPYRSRSDDEPRMREVEPAHLECTDGHWFLRAYAPELEAWRTYRLDRMSTPELTDETFTPRDFEPDTFSYDLIEFAPRAMLEIAPGASFEKRDWPCLHIEHENPDGGLSASVPFRNASWLADMIIASDGGVSLIEGEDTTGIIGARCAQKTEQLDAALAAAERLTDPDFAPYPVQDPRVGRCGYCSKEELLEMFSHSAS